MGPIRVVILYYGETSSSVMDEPNQRVAPLEMTGAEFRSLGYTIVDRVADFLDSIRKMPVRPQETVREVRQVLGSEGLPENGESPDKLLDDTASLLYKHSLFNGHPRFWGYITSSAAPIGALADLMAAVVNPNVGGWDLSPIATEIESQAIRWISEMIRFPTSGGGIMVSGGNMANFVCFLAARRKKIEWDVRAEGISGGSSRQPRVYASTETHTWIQKATDLFGLGTNSINWIPVDDQQRIKIDELSVRIREDKRRGRLPTLVVGNAGTVSTGAIDPLSELRKICTEEDLWFHVDGAYGGFAASLPDVPNDLKALGQADSVAVDPHKWLYSRWRQA